MILLRSRIKKLTIELIITQLLLVILFTYLPSPCVASDSDSDGLQDHEEIRYKTDIYDADTDDDGVLDGQEIDWNKNTDGKGGINALDPDSDDDGIYDGTEMGLISSDIGNDSDLSNGYFFPDADPKTNTSMVHWDSDGDCISDGTEDTNRNGKFEKKINETDPNFPDSDNDGIPNYEDEDIDGDGMFNEFEKLFDLDPKCDPNDAWNDDDQDGFTNLREYLGHDNKPGNNDWSDPLDYYSTPDQAPYVKFSISSINVYCNESIEINQSILLVTDSEEDIKVGLTYIWKWGDGDIDEERINDPAVYRKKHTYTKPGSYQIKLTVIDQYDKSGNDTLKISVSQSTVKILDNKEPTGNNDEETKKSEQETITFFSILIFIILFTLILVGIAIFVLMKNDKAKKNGKLDNIVAPEYRIVPVVSVKDREPKPYPDRINHHSRFQAHNSTNLSSPLAQSPINHYMENDHFRR